MYEYFLRRNLDFIRAGFYAQGSSKDFSEGAGRAQGEAPGWLYYGLVRTRTDSYGRTRTDLYGRTRTDSYGLVRTRTDSYGRARTDSYGRARTDSYGRPRTDSYGRNADVFTTDRFSPYYGLVRTRTDCLGGFTTDSYERWLGQVGRSVADAGGLKRLCSRDIRGYIEMSGIASPKSCPSGGGVF